MRHARYPVRPCGAYHGKANEYPALLAAASAGLTKRAVEKSSAISLWMFRVGLWHYASQARDEGWLAVERMIGGSS